MLYLYDRNVTCMWQLWYNYERGMWSFHDSDAIVMGPLWYMYVIVVRSLYGRYVVVMW